MSKIINTPILIIGFNRPDLMKSVINQVRLVKPNKLYFAIDGARNKSEEGKISDVRSIAKTIDWNCEVKTNFQKKNLGCKYGPVMAMKWFFENEEKGIILEDDVVVDETFFYFAEELLEKYEKDQRIGSISANNFQFGEKRGEGSFYFSRYSHSCGWATWRRAWNRYDVDIRSYSENHKEVINNVFNKWIDKYYWKLIFDGIKSNEIDSAWDYQWNWMMWKNKMLGIIPNNNLATNIGFGRKDATHTKLNSRFAEQKIEPIDFPLIIPNRIERDCDADEFTQKNNYVLWKEMLMNLFRKICIIYRKCVGGK